MIILDEKPGQLNLQKLNCNKIKLNNNKKIQKHIKYKNKTNSEQYINNTKIQLLVIMEDHGKRCKIILQNLLLKRHEDE